MEKLFITLALLLLFSGGLAAAAFPVTVQDKAFCVSLQQLVQRGDKAKLATLVKYPLKVSVGWGDLIARGPKDFVAHYDEIFSPDVIAAIQKQDPEKLFKNWQGVMVGSGEVWFGAIKLTNRQQEYSVLIVGVNPAIKITAHGYFGGTVRAAMPEDIVRRGERLVEEGKLKEAYELTLPFAKAGDADAQFALGVLLLSDDIKLPPEYLGLSRARLALCWVEKAALQGNNEACTVLADSYEKGVNGVAVNPEVEKRGHGMTFDRTPNT